MPTIAIGSSAARGRGRGAPAVAGVLAEPRRAGGRRAPRRSGGRRPAVAGSRRPVAGAEPVAQLDRGERVEAEVLEGPSPVDLGGPAWPSTAATCAHDLVARVPAGGHGAGRRRGRPARSAGRRVTPRLDAGRGASARPSTGAGVSQYRSAGRHRSAGRTRRGRRRRAPPSSRPRVRRRTPPPARSGARGPPSSALQRGRMTAVALAPSSASALRSGRAAPGAGPHLDEGAARPCRERASAVSKTHGLAQVVDTSTRGPARRCRAGSPVTVE